MRNGKIIVLIVISLVFLGSLGYLTLLIQDGSNPLGMFGIRASNTPDEQDPFLTQNGLGNQGAGNTSSQNVLPSPTPVELAYNSTSPTVTPIGTGSTSPTATLSATIAISTASSPTITSSPTPTVMNVVLVTDTVTPTVIQKLPVSGITDHFDKILISGGILILIGLLL